MSKISDKPQESEILENVSHETKEQKLDSNQIFKELKEIKDKLDSFEISEDEQESIIKNAVTDDEPKDKAKTGIFLAILGVIAIACVIFWDKIIEIAKSKNSDI